MKKLTFLAYAVMIVGCATQPQQSDMQSKNPFYEDWDTPYGVPPFGEIKATHYLPAFQEGMSRQVAEVETMASMPDSPTFQNTIGVFEQSGDLLKKVSGVFFNLTSAHTNDSLKEISQKVSPLLSAHRDNIFLNEKFYEKVKDLYDNKNELELTEEQAKLLDIYHTRFIKAGAALNDADKAKVRKLNEQLSLLTVEFGENVLDETNTFELVLTGEELEGLPESIIAAASDAARERGYEGKYVFTTHRPSLYPFITYSARRELRKRLKKGYMQRGDNDDGSDNKELVRKIANIRLEKANLLGFDNWASYVLQDRMLNNPGQVYELLGKVWPAALEAAKAERDLMKAMSEREGKDLEIMPWDWWYYAGKVRNERYDLDESEIRPYLQVDNVIRGAFALAETLFGLQFEERADIPKYHPEVKTYTVRDRDGELIGIYLSDWFYRSSKRGGAWMNFFRRQSNMNGDRVLPIVTNVGNFTKPTGNTPSLLSQDEANTLFHEFGHALHGLLSDCTYPSISGTATPRDFVEFPSQVMENWVFEPQMLERYAFHYQTGDVMPLELVKKMRAAKNFNQGFETVEYMAAAYLDMEFHTITEPLTGDIDAFEKSAMDKIGLIEAIVPRYRTGYFQHAFSDPEGYSAGYYSYLNAEVMDADAFGLFKENGLFDQETAEAYREHILSKGGTRDAMDMYVAFRGRKPDFQAILKRRGFE